MNHIQPIIMNSQRPRYYPVAPKFRLLDKMGLALVVIFAAGSFAFFLGHILSANEHHNRTDRASHHR